MNIEERFEKYDEEYVKFDRIENKLSNRPDLHAFLMLDKMFPHGSDMVSAAEHDEIFLDVDVDKFNEVATDDQIRDLCRCGVRYDESTDSLSMFV